jgi:hypothetical protein
LPIRFQAVFGQAVAEATVGFDAKGTKMLVDISCSSIW